MYKPIKKKKQLYGNDYYNSKGGGGMSLAIKKFTHPYSLTHKDYNKEKG